MVDGMLSGSLKMCPWRTKCTRTKVRGGVSVKCHNLQLLTWDKELLPLEEDNRGYRVFHGQAGVEDDMDVEDDMEVISTIH